MKKRLSHASIASLAGHLRLTLTSIEKELLRAEVAAFQADSFSIDFLDRETVQRLLQTKLSPAIRGNGSNLDKDWPIPHALSSASRRQHYAEAHMRTKQKYGLLLVKGNISACICQQETVRMLQPALFLEHKETTEVLLRLIEQRLNQ